MESDLGDRLKQRFQQEKGLAHLPQRRLAVIAELASSELLTAAGFRPDKPAPRGLTAENLLQHFLAVRSWPTTTAEIQREAAEIVHALSLASIKASPRARSGTADALGRVCALCWRCEAKPQWKDAFGRCDMHKPLASPLKGEFESEEHKTTRRQVRRAIDLSKRVLSRTPKWNIGLFGYPILLPRPPAPDLVNLSWKQYVETYFPLTVMHILNVKHGECLRNYIATLEALEDRQLTETEKRHLEQEFDALPTLMRCETWQTITHVDNDPLVVDCDRV